MSIENGANTLLSIENLHIEDTEISSNQSLFKISSKPSVITVTNLTLLNFRGEGIIFDLEYSKLVLQGGKISTFSTNLLTAIASQIEVNSLEINDFNTPSNIILFLTENSLLTLTASTFSENTNLGDGCVIVAIQGCSLKISNSFFTKNIAQTGSVILLDNTVDLTITDSHFTENKAKGGALAGKGGVIWAEGSLGRMPVINRILTQSPTITIIGSEFLQNNAEYGGAIFLENQALSLQNCNLTGNSAEVAGGGLMTAINDVNLAVTLTQVKFEGNSAKLYGGSVYTL